MGPITKKRHRYLRTLLIHGARASLLFAARHDGARSRWALQLWRKRGMNVATVALANKNARVLWKLVTSGEHYHRQPPNPIAERVPPAQRLASPQPAQPHAAAARSVLEASLAPYLKLVQDGESVALLHQVWLAPGKGLFSCQRTNLRGLARPDSLSNEQGRDAPELCFARHT
jgi:hypothetical protein